MTSRVVVHCTFCDTPYNYDFTTEPRMWCNKCKKQFRFKSQLTASQNSHSKKGSRSGSRNHVLDRKTNLVKPSSSSNNSPVIINDDPEDPLLLENLDTIKEMEKTIQYVEDPVKRGELINKLHYMKLRPIKNVEKKTLKELFDAQ